MSKRLHPMKKPASDRLLDHVAGYILC